MNEENKLNTETNVNDVAEHTAQEESNVVNENVVEEDFSNNYDMEAEVIGELKKERVGKPSVVLGMLAIFLIIIIILPIINGMLNDENSTLYRLVYGTTSDITPTPNDPNKVEFLDGHEYQLVSSDINVKYDNLIIKDMYIKKNILFASLKSYNGVIDLDDSQIYLEVYTNSKKLLSTIKLTGKLDFQETKYELTNQGLNFNETTSYYIKLKEMQDGDFPKVTLETDESGIGTMTCTKDNRTIEYTFKNNYLISIKDTENYLLSDYTESEYLNLMQIYKDKSTNLNTSASVEENETGFIYNALINLEEPGYTIPNTIKDNNYFKLDKEAKYIKYEQAGKGFDCK